MRYGIGIVIVCVLALVPSTARAGDLTGRGTAACGPLLFAPATADAGPRLLVRWTGDASAPNGLFDGARLDRAPVPCEPARARTPDLLDAAEALADAAPQTAPPPVAFEYSHGYQVRNRIHHDASYAMLPLFVAEAVIGQQMFNDPAQTGTWRRSAHRVMGTAIIGLFGVNTVTGLWNLKELREDPNSGVLPIVHAVLMLVADGGFVATALMKPNSHSPKGLTIYDAKKNQHMALAYASISTATVGYLIMLFR